MREALGPGALGKSRGSGWRGRWEGGSGWGTHVNPWLFHSNVWQNSLQIKKKKKRKFTWRSRGSRISNTILKSKVRGLHDLYKATVIKTLCCWLKNRKKIGQWSQTESPERDSLIKSSSSWSPIMEKNLKKKKYVYLNHFALHLKWTQLYSNYTSI